MPPDAANKIAPPARDLVLDFWRGISVLMVLSSHFFYFHFIAFRNFLPTTSWIASLSSVALFADKILIEFSYRSGQLGVRIFFIISGYIITKLFLEEEKKNGRINILRFYFRRIFRILPAFYFYLACLAVFGALGWVALGKNEIFYAAALLCNTNLYGCGWDTAHSWTLAIEEQFYIVWPLVFLLISPRSRGRFLGVTLAVLIALSSFGLLIANGWMDNAIAFACIAIGALYAVSDPFRAYVQKHSVATSLGMIAILGFMAIAPSADVRDFAHLAYREVTPFLLLTVIVLTYSFPRFIKSLFFNAITKVGLISYSLYIWQQPFDGEPNAWNYPMHSPLEMWYLMFPLALFSYFVIEKPSIAWAKNYLKTRKQRTNPPSIKVAGDPSFGKRD